MLAVQMRGLLEGNEELGAVCVLSCVSHAQQEGLVVLELEVFILKLSSIDTFTPSSIKLCEVSSLGHESSDDTMKNGIEKVQVLARLGGSALFSSAETSEILSGQWSNIFEELHLHSSRWLSLNLNIKINARICWV